MACGLLLERRADGRTLIQAEILAFELVFRFLNGQRLYNWGREWQLRSLVWLDRS